MSSAATKPGGEPAEKKKRQRAVAGPMVAAAKDVDRWNEFLADRKTKLETLEERVRFMKREIEAATKDRDGAMAKLLDVSGGGTKPKAHGAT